MTSREDTTASPEVLFDVPSMHSPELSFSTPRVEPVDIHEESKTSAQDVDEVTKTTEHASNGNSTPEYADKPSSKELEGLRTVNLTPTSPTSNGQHDEQANIEAERTSSPPIVLKSAPGTPTAEPTFLHQMPDGEPSPPLTTDRDVNVSESPNGALNHQKMQEDLDDPRELVISSLRTQISDLFSQVNLLNSKLVQSYDRVSTLEETLDDNTERLQALEGERMNLEREKSVIEMEMAKHDQMLKDGRLVERSAVATELSRLMEESLASSSAKQSAEAKHKQMESELSDLSANLFSTANEMVATERQRRAAVEQSLTSAQATNALLEKELEASRVQLGSIEKEKGLLHETTTRTEKEVEELRRALRGVNSSNVASQGTGGILRMMNSHVPYKNEYLAFLGHLRGLVGSTQYAPAITSLLTLPFLARLAVEDSEPTLRLDLAPSLNWLTRRSVLAAIHSNTLLIEQIHVATLFLEGSASSYSYGGFGSGASLPTSPTQLTKVNCSLCGKVVYMSPEAIQAEQDQSNGVIISQSPITPTPTTFHTPAVAPSPQRSVSGSGWGASKFLKSVTLPSLGSVVANNNTNGSRSNSPAPRHSLDSLPVNSVPVPTAGPVERSSSPPPPTSLQTVIHAFRLPVTGRPSNTSTSNLPTSDPSQASENYGPPYPLCHTGWCLSRLKTTLDLWGCVKTEVVERVWTDGQIERRRLESGSNDGRAGTTFEVSGAVPITVERDTVGTLPTGSDIPPPVPSKRKIPNLWGMGKDVLDKAKAYGSGSPGSDSAVSTPTVPSSAGGSSFFGGVRRSFSGSAVATNATTPAVSVLDVKSAEPEPVTIVGESGMGTVKGPSLPKRNTGRLSAIFGVAQGEDSAPQAGAAALEETPVEKSTPEIHTDDAPSPEVSLGTSVSVDNFVTPSETPMLQASPNINDDGRMDGASADALSSAIQDHIVNASRDSTDLTTPVDMEPPTPTPNSIGFGATTGVSSKKPAHARNTSIASIISEGNTATPRPSTPVTSALSDSNGAAKTGSRPSTPGKSSIPPPVPRRAAARNAARTSIVIPAEQKQGGGGLDGVGEEPSTKEADATGNSDVQPEATKVDAESNAADETSKARVDADTIPLANDVQQETSGLTAPSSGNTTAPLGVSTVHDSSTELQDTATEFSAGDSLSAPASAKSPSTSLPIVEPPTPVSPSVPPSVVGIDDQPSSSFGNTRPRQASVVSTSSVYSPSVYTTNSGVNPPGFPEAETEHRDGKHAADAVKFYVGRESWEERAWLQLVEIRESMFWARLGGVRY